MQAIDVTEQGSRQLQQVAAIQMASGPNSGANLLEAARLIRQAAEGGAKLVVLPENFAVMGRDERDKVAQSETDGSGPLQEFLAEQALRHQIWLVGGTIPLRSRDPQRVRAACLVYDERGQRRARYDKVHLFDVHLSESGENYNESESIEGGDEVVVIDTPLGRLGLAICYDLRFPELFRGLSQQGAEMIALPAAFTAITGRAHWDVLVRARAIENLCYVIASAQGGFHASGRETYGHTMIIDPWGQHLAELPRGAGVVSAPIDRRRVAEIRRTFPTLDHRRMGCSVGH